MSKFSNALRAPTVLVSRLVRRLGGAALFPEWAKRGFAAPSPHFIKQQVVVRNGLANATWVETGTYMGDTTRLLSCVGKSVYSLEPEPRLFARAAQLFQGVANVTILNGTSETMFPQLLPTLSGDVCFWLDGHYSGGGTFKGTQDTPVVDELRVIGENLALWGNVVVMVDDIRYFDPRHPEHANYPTIDFLVDWAREHKLSWHIEHDIFIAQR